MNYVDRPICEVLFPLVSGVRLLYFEQTIVKFDDGQSVDLGCLCYLRRSMQSRKLGHGTKVDLSSFDPERAVQVGALISCANEWSLSGQRPTSVYAKFARFKKFMDWCDANGQCHVLRDVESARATLREYTAHVGRLVDQHQVANNTAAGYQNLIMLVLEDFLGTDELGRGINLLSIIPELSNMTQVPGDDDQSRALAWAQCIFDGFWHLLVERTESGALIPMPFFLKLPAQTNQENQGMWVFPLKHWNVAIKSSRELNCAYDYQAGRLRTFEEVALLFPNRIARNIREPLEIAEGIMQEANRDPHHWFRMRQGMLAMSAF